MKCATVEVPRLGAAVKVQSIAPAALRMISQKATKGGQVDFQELMVLKLTYGLRAPNLTEAEARELTSRLTLGTLKPILDGIDRLSGTDEHLRGADRPRPTGWLNEAIVMATAWLNRARAIGQGRHRRASRGAKPVRRRGSRRLTASPSSSDDPPSDTEPPERRFCENGRCGRDISELHPLRHYCDDACRQEAYRDRQLLAKLEELEGTSADPRTMCKGECAKHSFIVDGASFHCGKSLTGVRGRLDDDGLPRQALGYVSAPRMIKRRSPRLGDRQRKPHGVRKGVITRV